ncbi:amino acid permease [Neisseriaceae bacterium ESL0693]|nr:amino acid permease [Neisseriaceae bacterium ESL0693]
MKSFEQLQCRETGLHKKLSSRQMSMIAIGSAMGTGLFLGSKFAIGFAGPAVVISYAIGALITLILIACLTEMTIQHPTTGSFATYAEYYIHPLAGFLVRYCYWICNVLAIGTEVLAIADYMKFWFPDISTWLWIILFPAILVCINAYSVNTFGSIEYWFSAIKIFAIIAFIILTSCLLFTHSHPAQIRHHLFDFGGFAPHGFNGIWMGVIISIFSFLGIEMIAIAAGEAKEPEKAIKYAFKATLVRLFLFYLLTLALIVALVPWPQLVQQSNSPFVSVMQSLNIPFAASILNFIVIIAALSAMNSMLYITTRMLFSLSRARQAPAFFGQVNPRGVPVYALLLSSAGIAVAVMVHLAKPETAFPVMMALAMFGALFSWGMIFVSHLFFRFRLHQQNIAVKFRLPGFPLTSLAGLLAIIAILISTWYEPQFHATLLFGLPFILLLIGIYGIKHRYHNKH